MNTLQTKLMLVYCVLVAVVPWCAGTASEPVDKVAGRLLAQCALERSELLDMCHSSLVDKLALTDTVSHLMATVESLKEENTAVRGEHAGVLSEHLAAMDAYATLRESHLSLQKENNHLKKDLLIVQEDYSGLQKNQQNLLEGLVALQKQTEALQQAQEAQDNEYGQLRHEHQSLETSHLKLGQDFHVLNEQYLGVTANYRTVTTHYMALRDHLHRFVESHAALEKDHLSLQEDYHSLQQDHGTLQGLLQQSEDSVRLVLHEKEQLSLALRNKEEENEIANTKLAKALQKNEQLVTGILRLKDTWETIHRENTGREESLLLQNRMMKFEMQQHNERHIKELQNMNDMYLSSVREKDEKERLYGDKLTACHTEKEQLEKERDDTMSEMYQMKDNMLKELQQLEKNNTQLSSDKHNMQTFYDNSVNVCFKKLKANEATAKNEMAKVVQMKLNAIDELRKVERNLSHVAREKEEMEDYYSASAVRCVAEQATMLSHMNEELHQMQEREIQVVTDLKKVSENNTRIQWEKDELENYYVNLVGQCVLEADLRDKYPATDTLGEEVLQKSNDPEADSNAEMDDLTAAYEAVSQSILGDEIVKEGNDDELKEQTEEMTDEENDSGGSEPETMDHQTEMDDFTAAYEALSQYILGEETFKEGNGDELQEQTEQMTDWDSDSGEGEQETMDDNEYDTVIRILLQQLDRMEERLAYLKQQQNE